MDRFQIIEALEGRMAPALGGKFYYVKGGKFWTKIGQFLLTEYPQGQLERMLENSRPPWKTAKQMMEEDPTLSPEDAVFYEKSNMQEWEAFEVAERIFDKDDTLTQAEVGLAQRHGFIEYDLDTEGWYPVPTEKYNDWTEQFYNI